MTINNQLFDGLVIFTQVLESGSFTAAAEATGHSTSYVSKEINRLEARLGVRLLNRTTRSISLTPEGQHFYEQCQQLVQDAEQAQAVLNQTHHEPQGVLRLSCPVVFGLNYLQPIISEYMSRYPKIALEMDFNDREVDLVQEGFDLVIRATARLEASSLISRKVYQCKAYTVASPDYLDRHGRPKHPDDLKRHRCICYTNLKSPNRWPFQDSKGGTISVDVEQTILCNNAAMELAMVLDGHGICRLPEFYMEKELQTDGLEILFPEYVPPDVEVYAVYPSRKHLASKVRLFIDLLAERLSSGSVT